MGGRELLKHRYILSGAGVLAAENKKHGYFYPCFLFVKKSQNPSFRFIKQKFGSIFIVIIPPLQKGVRGIK